MVKWKRMFLQTKNSRFRIDSALVALLFRTAKKSSILIKKFSVLRARNIHVNLKKNTRDKKMKRLVVPFVSGSEV